MTKQRPKRLVRVRVTRRQVVDVYVEVEGRTALPQAAEACHYLQTHPDALEDIDPARWTTKIVWVHREPEHVDGVTPDVYVDVHKMHAENRRRLEAGLERWAKMTPEEKRAYVRRALKKEEEQNDG